MKRQAYRPRILCVDDNVQMQSALKLGLGVYGFEVITASHGIEAIAQYDAHAGDFCALVTNNDMPQMGGLELVRSVREMGFGGCIVVISGRLNVDVMCDYQNYAISGFFHKPFEISLLAEMLLQSG